MLDLTDILTDPDLAGQPFTIHRRSRSVGSNGRANKSLPTLVPAAGSIQPAPAKMLERLAEEDRQREVVVIYTVAPLTPGSEGTPADVVAATDAFYTVRQVKQFSQFGASHFEALAVLLTAEGDYPFPDQVAQYGDGSLVEFGDSPAELD